MEELSPYLENPWNQSMAIFAISLILTVILRWILRFLLSSWIQKTETKLDDILIKALRKLVTYSIPLIGLMVALTPLALPTQVPQRLLFSLLSVLLFLAPISFFLLPPFSSNKTSSTMSSTIIVCVP